MIAFDFYLMSGTKQEGRFFFLKLKILIREGKLIFFNAI
jgi:hypothetical protein